jgi:hypothetical protein
MAESNARKATNKILVMIEEGVLNKDTVINACLKYMSEADVADMAHANEFFEDDSDDSDAPDDDDDMSAEEPISDDERASALAAERNRVRS